MTRIDTLRTLGCAVTLYMEFVVGAQKLLGTGLEGSVG